MGGAVTWTSHEIATRAGGRRRNAEVNGNRFSKVGMRFLWRSTDGPGHLIAALHKTNIGPPGRKNKSYFQILVIIGGDCLFG
jgi:hypothetical protein